MQAELAMMMNPKELISEGVEGPLYDGNGNEDYDRPNLSADLMVMSRRLMVRPQAQQLVVDCDGNHDVPDPGAHEKPKIIVMLLQRRVATQRSAMAQEGQVLVPPVLHLPHPQQPVVGFGGSSDATDPGVPEQELQPPDRRLEGIASSYSPFGASA